LQGQISGSEEQIVNALKASAHLFDTPPQNGNEHEAGVYPTILKNKVILGSSTQVGQIGILH
jgi:hypothetical protein